MWSGDLAQDRPADAAVPGLSATLAAGTVAASPTDEIERALRTSNGTANPRARTRATAAHSLDLQQHAPEPGVRCRARDDHVGDELPARSHANQLCGAEHEHG